MKFQVIVADPPWSFSDKLQQSNVKRGAEANYSTMTIDNIKQLPIANIADPDGAILCLWVPSSLLKEGIEIMESFGFQMKQTFIWVKNKKTPLVDVIDLIKPSKSLTDKNYRSYIGHVLNLLSNIKMSSILSFGMGRLFRNTHEICLIGINNTKIYRNLQNKSQRSVCFAQNLKHSSKPENLQDSLDIMFPDVSINKIELFARRQRRGWMCLGNESPSSLGEDILFSINKLIDIK